MTPSPSSVRVLVVAGDPIVREALSGRISNEPDIVPIDDPADGDTLSSRSGAQIADAVLLDAGPYAESDFLSDLQQFESPVVALLPDDSLARLVLMAGARGVLLRSADTATITRALVAAAGDLVVVDPALAELVFTVREPVAETEALTPREAEVLQLLAEGLPNKLIADRLAISESTVKFHVSSVLSKLGAHSRTEAVMLAARLGMLII